VKTPVSGAFPVVLLFFCLSGALYPQTAPAGDAAGPSYLIPQTVFVGDRGRLVVPVGVDFLKIPPLVIRNPVFLPEPENLKISRVELEHRGGISRLLIDFIAYAPGDFILPSIEIPLPQDQETSLVPSRSAHIRLTGIHLKVASILNGETLVLSPPASPLAVPGTALMIYGTVAALILLILGVIAGRLRGGDLLRRWRKGRRRRLIVLLKNTLRRLKRDLLRAKPGLPGTGELFGRVSGEFRSFLGLFTGVNCQALAAGEFLSFSFAASPGEGDPRLSGSFLRDLFRRWDGLRFSGRDITAEEFLGVLEELLAFLSLLWEAERLPLRQPGGHTAAAGPAGSEPAPPPRALFPGGAG
jgi:hypothetical protein